MYTEDYILHKNITRLYNIVCEQRKQLIEIQNTLEKHNNEIEKLKNVVGMVDNE